MMLSEQGVVISNPLGYKERIGAGEIKKNNISYVSYCFDYLA